MRIPTSGSINLAVKPKVAVVPVVEICGSCGFYRPPPDGPVIGGIVRTGYCRRYPAAEQKMPNEWCGEYRHRGNG